MTTLGIQRCYSLLEHPLPYQPAPIKRPHTTVPQDRDQWSSELSDEEEGESVAPVLRPLPWRTLRPRSARQITRFDPSSQTNSYNNPSPYITVPQQIHPIMLHSVSPRYEDVIQGVRSRVQSASRKPSLYSSLHGKPVSRYGRAGAPWRHVRRTLGYEGNNVMFVDGSVKQDDTIVNPPWTWESLHAAGKGNLRMQAYVPALSQTVTKPESSSSFGTWQRDHERTHRYSPRNRLMSER